MIILRVRQECSRNLSWIVFSCTLFRRPLVRANPNNSPTFEFDARMGRGGALPLALSLVLVVGPLGRRWSGSRAAWPSSPCMRYPTRVRVLLSLPFCSLAKEADSLVFLWFALNIVFRIAQGVSIFHLWRAAGSSCVAPTPDKAPARAAPCRCPPCFFKFAI